MKLACDICTRDYSFDDGDLDLNAGSIKEPPGSSKKVYSGIFSGECDYCGNLISVEFEFYEYPEGVLYSSNISENGCVIKEEPDYQKLIDLN